MSKQIDAIYPFFNVQIQGLYKQASMLADSEKRGTFVKRKVLSSFISALFVLTANAVLGGKDEYEKLSDYTKNNYYCFHVGGGKFVKIPKARELDVLESAVERLGEVVLYRNSVGDSFDNFAEYVFQAYAPLGFPDLSVFFDGEEGNTLEALKPMVTDLLFFGSVAEAFFNENYSGSPIVPAQYEKLLLKEQYNNKTSAVAKWLGNILNASPMQIDYLMTSNLGFVGKMLKAYTAKDFDWTGGYGNQLSADVAYSNDATSKFYDELEEAEMYASTYSDNGEYKSTYKQYESASSVLSYCNRKARENPDMEREYKMLALAYASEFLDGGVAQNERLNEIYAEYKDSAIYPYREFKDTYTKTVKDEKGNSTTVEVTMTSQEFLEYVNSYNAAIDELYGEILEGISDDAVASKALVKAKEEANEYARSGKMSNVMIAKEAGVSAAQYYTIRFTASADGNNSIKKEEAIEALNKSSLTNKQKAIVFDLLGSWKQNPYRRSYY